MWTSWGSVPTMGFLRRRLRNPHTGDTQHIPTQRVKNLRIDTNDIYINDSGGAVEILITRPKDDCTHIRPIFTMLSPQVPRKHRIGADRPIASTTLIYLFFPLLFVEIEVWVLAQISYYRCAAKYRYELCECLVLKLKPPTFIDFWQWTTITFLPLSLQWTRHEMDCTTR
jgi:hypothetical protein